MVIEYYPTYIKGAGGSLEVFWKILDKYFDYKKVEGDFTKFKEGDYNYHYNLICKRKPKEKLDV